MYSDEGPGFDPDVPVYGDYDYERPFKPVYSASTVYPVSSGAGLPDVGAYDPGDYKSPAYWAELNGY